MQNCYQAGDAKLLSHVVARRVNTHLPRLGCRIAIDQFTGCKIAINRMLRCARLVFVVSYVVIVVCYLILYS